MSEAQLIVLLYLLVGLRLLLHLYPALLVESWRRWTNELLDAIVIAGVTALLLINFVVRSFYIPSGSMEPTLVINDYILVNEFIYHFVRPHRGDIVVFRPVDGSKQDLVKRVVGIEGDVLEIREGKLYRNDQRIEESFVPEEILPDDRHSGPFLVKPGHLFMMGDNRNHSYDSRYWGQVPLENVVGQAFMIFMNPGEPYRIKLRWFRCDQGTPTVSQ